MFSDALGVGVEGDRLNGATSRAAQQSRAAQRTRPRRRSWSKGLGLFDSTMIVVGSMIGSGIFIVSADIAHQVQSPGLLLVVWLVAGVMTLIGALSYGELAAAMPHAGGQYVYLRESLGPLWGFLYGWTMLLVIQTATIAAVAIAFAKFTGVIVPWFSAIALDLEDRHVRSLAISGSARSGLTTSA